MVLFKMAIKLQKIVEILAAEERSKSTSIR